MTMPEPDEPRDAQPLGSEAAPPGDPESQGGTPRPGRRHRRPELAAGRDRAGGAALTVHGAAVETRIDP